MSRSNLEHHYKVQMQSDLASFQRSWAKEIEKNGAVTKSCPEARAYLKALFKSKISAHRSGTYDSKNMKPRLFAGKDDSVLNKRANFLKKHPVKKYHEMKGLPLALRVEEPKDLEELIQSIPETNPDGSPVAISLDLAISLWAQEAYDYCADLLEPALEKGNPFQGEGVLEAETILEILMIESENFPEGADISEHAKVALQGVALKRSREICEERLREVFNVKDDGFLPANDQQNSRNDALAKIGLRSAIGQAGGVTVQELQEKLVLIGPEDVKLTEFFKSYQLSKAQKDLLIPAIRSQHQRSNDRDRHNIYADGVDKSRKEAKGMAGAARKHLTELNHLQTYNARVRALPPGAEKAAAPAVAAMAAAEAVLDHQFVPSAFLVHEVSAALKEAIPPEIVLPDYFYSNVATSALDRFILKGKIFEDDVKGIMSHFMKDDALVGISDESKAIINAAADKVVHATKADGLGGKIKKLVMEASPQDDQKAQSVGESAQAAASRAIATTIRHLELDKSDNFKEVSFQANGALRAAEYILKSTYFSEGKKEDENKGKGSLEDIIYQQYKDREDAKASTQAKKKAAAEFELAANQARVHLQVSNQDSKQIAAMQLTVARTAALGGSVYIAVYALSDHDLASSIRKDIVNAYLSSGPINEAIVKNILEKRGISQGRIPEYTNNIMQSAGIALAITEGVKAKKIDQPLAAKKDLIKELINSKLVSEALATKIANSIDYSQEVKDEGIQKIVEAEVSRINKISLKISKLDSGAIGIQRANDDIKKSFQSAVADIAKAYAASSGQLDDSTLTQIMRKHFPQISAGDLAAGKKTLMAQLHKLESISEKEESQVEEVIDEKKQESKKVKLSESVPFLKLPQEAVIKITQISQEIYRKIPSKAAFAGAKAAALAAGASSEEAEGAAKAAQSACIQAEESKNSRKKTYSALSAIQQLPSGKGFAPVAVAAVVSEGRDVISIRKAYIQSLPRTSMAMTAAVASAVAATAVKENLATEWVDLLADRIAQSSLDHPITEEKVKASIIEVCDPHSDTFPSEEARKNIYRSAWRAYAETLGLQAIEDARKLFSPDEFKPKERAISAISAAVVVAGIGSGMTAKDSAEMAKRIAKYYVEQENVARVDMAAALAAQDPKINLTSIQVNKLRLAAQAAAEISEPVDAVSAGTSVAAKIFPAFNHPEQASAMAAVIAKACKGSGAAIGTAAAYAEGISIKAASSPFSLGAAVAAAVSHQVNDLKPGQFANFDSKSIKENVRNIMAQSEAGIDYKALSDRKDDLSRQISRGVRGAGRRAMSAFENIYNNETKEMFAGSDRQGEARSKIAKAVAMAAHIHISARKLGLSSEQAKELSASYAGAKVTGEAKQLFLITEASLAYSRTGACLDKINDISQTTRYPLGIADFKEKRQAAKDNGVGHIPYGPAPLLESDVSNRADPAKQLAKDAFLRHSPNPNPSKEEIAAAEVAGLEAQAKVYLEALKSKKFATEEDFNKVAEKAKAIDKAAASIVKNLLLEPSVQRRIGDAHFEIPEKVHTSKIEELVKAGRSAFLINKGISAGKAAAEAKEAAVAAIQAIMEEAELDSSAATEALQKSIASGADPAEVGALVAAASPAKPEVSQALAAVAAHFAPLKKVELRQQPVLKEGPIEEKYEREGKRSDKKSEAVVAVKDEAADNAVVRAKAIIEAVGAAAIGDARELPPGAEERRAAELVSEEEYQRKKRDFQNVFAAMRESEGRPPADSMGISSAMKKFGLDISTQLDAKNAGDWVIKISSSDPMEEPKRMEEIEELKPFVERMRACDGFVTAETLRIAIDQFNKDNRSWSGKDPLPKDAIKVRPDGSIKVSLEKLSKSQVAKLVDLWTQASEFARDHTQHMSKTKRELSGNSRPRMPSA